MVLSVNTFEGQIIKPTLSEDGEVLISGYELHSFLEAATRFDKWIQRQLAFGFEENQDYFIQVQKRPTKNPKNPFTEIKDYILKMDAAKEIAMLQRNEKGKEARQYFLKIEKFWNSPEMIMKRALEMANAQAEQLAKQKGQLEILIEQQKPKIAFADALIASESVVTVGELAKILRQGGTKTGQKRLMQRLRDDGYLMKRGGVDYNKPTQRAIDQELFAISRKVQDENGETFITKAPLITGKGQIYFFKKYSQGGKE